MPIKHFGRLMIGWEKRDPLGRPLHPWETLTLDQLEEPARLLITKMARLAARDFHDEVKNELWESVSIELGRRLAEALAELRAELARPQDRPAWLPTQKEPSE
jgi:hypothetical protein